MAVWGCDYTQSAQILRKIRCASPLFQAQPEIADGTTNFPQGMDEERWMELLKLSGAGQLNRR